MTVLVVVVVVVVIVRVVRASGSGGGCGSGTGSASFAGTTFNSMRTLSMCKNLGLKVGGWGGGVGGYTSACIKRLNKL